MTGALGDRVLHRSEAFRVPDGDIDRLKRSDASRARSEVGNVRELDALVGLSPHSNALCRRWHRCIIEAPIDPMVMEATKEPQRVDLLNYSKADGQELVGLAVEIAEDPNGGVQVRVLMDPAVVGGVTVVPLQQGGCCG